jgi:hypothetical protein
MDVITDRQYIPAPAIYVNNQRRGEKYGYLIPTDYAVDCYMGDAQLTDKNGNAKPGFECPVPRPAEAFGEKIADLPY